MSCRIRSRGSSGASFLRLQWLTPRARRVRYHPAEYALYREYGKLTAVQSLVSEASEPIPVAIVRALKNYREFLAPIRILKVLLCDPIARLTPAVCKLDPELKEASFFVDQHGFLEIGSIHSAKSEHRALRHRRDLTKVNKTARAPAIWLA